MVRHAPIHRRSGHSDIAICCGRNVRGSSPSTSVVPLSNQVTTLNHKRFKGFKMFSDGHQETKATDGSGHYLYLIDPRSYAVSRIGPYSGILGPYAVDGTSSYAVNNVTNIWGMQVANLKTGQIITANIPNHPSSGDVGLLHGIGWS